MHTPPLPLEKGDLPGPLWGQLARAFAREDRRSRAASLRHPHRILKEPSSRPMPPISSQFKAVIFSALPDVVFLVDLISENPAVFPSSSANGSFVVFYGLSNKTKSVTNDAVAVCPYVWQMAPKKRFIYRDSMGLWSELLHEYGRFTGFSPLSADSLTLFKKFLQ